MDSNYRIPTYLVLNGIVIAALQIELKFHRLFVPNTVGVGQSVMLINETNSMGAPRDVPNSRQVYAKFATRLITEIYHLVQPGGKHTVCGLRISRVMSDRKANTLQLVHELPSNLTICKHCERIRGQDLKE